MCLTSAPMEQFCVIAYLRPLKPGEYYQDIDPNLWSELTEEDEIAVHRSDLSTNDFIDVLTTVREIAFANIPNPIGNDKFNRLAAKEIKDLNREAALGSGPIKLLATSASH